MPSYCPVAWIYTVACLSNYQMLSKRFDVDFVVKNPKCFEASFTGVLEKQRLGRILEYISVSSNIKFKYAESNNIHQEKQKIEVY